MTKAGKTLQSAYNYFRLVRTTNTNIGYSLTFHQVAILCMLEELMSDYAYVCFALLLTTAKDRGIAAKDAILARRLNVLLSANLISKRRTGYGKMLYSITIKGQEYLEALKKAA